MNMYIKHYLMRIITFTFIGLDCRKCDDRFPGQFYHRYRGRHIKQVSHVYVYISVCLCAHVQVYLIRLCVYMYIYKIVCLYVCTCVSRYI